MTLVAISISAGSVVPILAGAGSTRAAAATPGSNPAVSPPGEVWPMTLQTFTASVAIPAETVRPARADCHDGIRARVRLPRLPRLRAIRVATLPELLGRIWI